MPANHDVLDSEHTDRIFNGCGFASMDRSVRRDDIPGVPQNEQLTRFGLREEVRIDARIRAGDEQCQRMLDVFARKTNMKNYVPIILLLIAGCGKSEEGGREQQLSEAERGVIRQLEKLGGTYESNADGHVTVVSLRNHPEDELNLGWMQHLPHLERLYLQYSHVTDESLKNLQGLKHLRRLSLHGTSITPAGLKYLSRLRNLEALDLDKTSNNHNGLVHLQCLTKLRELNLGDVTRLEGPDIAYLGNLKQLQVLRFKAEMDNAAFSRLGQLTNLRYLNLRSSTLNDIGLRQLAAMRQLEHLDLRFNPNVSDTGLKVLRGFHQLRRLWLQGTNTTDKGLAALSELVELRELNLRGLPITNVGLLHLQRLVKMNTLDLSYTRVADAGLGYLTGMRQLAEIRLTMTDVTDRGMVHLVQLPALRRVSPPSSTWRLTTDPATGKRNAREYLPRVTLVGISYLTFHGIEVDKSHSVKLHETGLVFTRAPSLDRLIGDEDLGFLKNRSEITRLQLQQTTVSDAGLATITDLPHLKYLTLSPYITGEGLRHVCEMRELKSLSLGDNGNIRPSDLANLAGARIETLGVRAGFTSNGGLAHFGALSNLKALRLYYRTTDANLAYLPRLPKLTHLCLWGSQVTDDGLQYLKQLPALEVLQLRSVAGIRGPGLQYLQELPSLRTIDLSHSNVGDEGLRNLAAVGSLEELNFEETAITDAGAVYVGRMRKLQKLDLGDNRRLTSKFLAKLSGLQELRELDLTYTSVDDTGMRFISQLTKLESLTLGDNRIRGEGLIDLEKMTQLKELTLWNSWVTWKSIVRLRKSLPECKIVAVDD